MRQLTNLDRVVMLTPVVLLLVWGALVIGSPFAKSSPDFTARITSCDISGSVAKVRVEVTNKKSRVASATVKIEYRDSSGNRLDTDTARVRSLAPGDTAVTEESTLLDADAGSGTCSITSVR